MSRGDGTGPKGQGPGTGRIMGRGGTHPGGGGLGTGLSGNCVCSSCGERAEHQLGIPCYKQKCPKCGAVMTRE